MSPFNRFSREALRAEGREGAGADPPAPVGARCAGLKGPRVANSPSARLMCEPTGSGLLYIRPERDAYLARSLPTFNNLLVITRSPFYPNGDSALAPLLRFLLRLGSLIDEFCSGQV